MILTFSNLHSDFNREGIHLIFSRPLDALRNGNDASTQDSHNAIWNSIVRR